MTRRRLETWDWAAGSYLELFIASAAMQIPFAVAMYWVFNVDATIFDLYGSRMVGFIGCVLIALGWMMAITLGCAFDILPLIHKVQPFDGTMLKLIAALNVSGQAFILLGIFLGQPALFEQLTTIGIALIAIQLILLGPPILKLRNQRKARNDEVGGFSYLPTLLLPIIGVVTLFTWLTWYNETLEAIFWLLVIDFYWLMLSLTIILAHFNRRLGWELIPADKIPQALALFIIAEAIHIGATIVHQLDWLGPNEYWLEATIAIPVLTTLAITRPDIVWKKVLDGERCSGLILSGQAWLLMTAFLGFTESVFHNHDNNLGHARFMISIGVSAQLAWGYAHWLHHDHRRTPTKERRGLDILLFAFNVALIGYFFVSIDHIFYLSLILDPVQYVVPIFLLFGFVSTLIWWLKEILFSYHDWHRIPMFYTEIGDSEDPYELGNTSEE